MCNVVGYSCVLLKGEKKSGEKAETENKVTSRHTITYRVQELNPAVGCRWCYLF